MAAAANQVFASGGGDLLGETARIAAQVLGEDQRDIAGEIAVLPVAGAFDLYVDGCVPGDRTLVLQGEHGPGEEFTQLVFHGIGSD